MERLRPIFLDQSRESVQMRLGCMRIAGATSVIPAKAGI